MALVTKALALIPTAVALLMVAPAAPAGPTQRVEDARIVFTSERDSSGIFVIAADGSAESQLTRRDPHGFAPAWSPDGSKIAFNGSSETTLALWVMGRNGEDPRVVGFRGPPEASFFSPRDPDWSPNSRRLVVSFRGDLFTIGSDGTARRRVTRGTSDDSGAVWSPTGAWLAFTRNGWIYRIRTNGTGLRRLAPGAEPDWSPSGVRIVFIHDADNGSREIFTMRRDGTDVRRLTRTPGDEARPAWSPGGGTIAFNRGRLLWFVDANGSNLRPVAGNADSPAWSPSGARLVVGRGRFAEFESATALVTIRRDGAQAQPILTPEFDREITASPDGTQIAFTSVRLFSASGVYTADSDGSGETFIHSGRSPDWSPDGSRILLQAEGGLNVVSPDGSNPVELPTPDGVTLEPEADPHWHPDGERVSFVGTADGACPAVYAMDLDGANLTRMTPSSCSLRVYFFDWEPSGTSVVVAADDGCEDCGRKLVRVSVPDGPAEVLTGEPLTSDGQPAVSPDGTQVAFERVDFSGLVEFDIWVMRIDGSGATRLTSSAANSAPDWLPAASLAP